MIFRTAVGRGFTDSVAGNARLLHDLQAKLAELAISRNSVGHGMGAIIILGGHRTGTSITARLVHELGFPAARSPDRLLWPRPGCERDNPDGYYEDVAFVHLHRRMLRENVPATGGWTNPCRDDAEIGRLRHRYRSLIRIRMAHSSEWSLKDPRLCLVGDILLESLFDLGIDVRIVTCTRPESQVVASLMRRGLHEADASRIAGIFEAGRNAILQIAQPTKAPCLELAFASAASREEVECEVRRLQQFLGLSGPDRTQSLAGLVRFER